MYSAGAMIEETLVASAREGQMKNPIGMQSMQAGSDRHSHDGRSLALPPPVIADLFLLCRSA
jgi:hypothetical protein